MAWSEIFHVFYPSCYPVERMAVLSIITTGIRPPSPPTKLSKHSNEDDLLCKDGVVNGPSKVVRRAWGDTGMNTFLFTQVELGGRKPMASCQREIWSRHFLRIYNEWNLGVWVELRSEGRAFSDKATFSTTLELRLRICLRPNINLHNIYAKKHISYFHWRFYFLSSYFFLLGIIPGNSTLDLKKDIYRPSIALNYFRAYPPPLRDSKIWCSPACSGRKIFESQFPLCSPRSLFL